MHILEPQMYSARRQIGDIPGLFPYKGCGDIPPLGFCDEVLDLSECGVEALDTNAVINAKFESKCLTSSDEKSNQIHNE